ncbi:hypothetical protein D3C81_909560 [compost metagenome]
MSGFSIMDIFRGKNPEQPSPAPQGSQQMVQTEQAPNGQQNQPNPTGATGEPDAPSLDKFKDLFTPLTAEQLAQNQDFNPDTMFASLEPTKIREAVGQIDFTKSISADDLAAISAGGNEAVAAFARAMNGVAQTTMAQGLLGSAELVKQAMKQANSGLDSRLGKAARQQMVQEALYKENPALRHPGAKPIVDALQQSLAVKNPTATPQELQEAASEYLNQFAAMIAGKGGEAEAKSEEAFDWSKHFLGQ